MVVAPFAGHDRDRDTAHSMVSRRSPSRAARPRPPSARPRLSATGRPRLETGGRARPRPAPRPSVSSAVQCVADERGVPGHRIGFGEGSLEARLVVDADHDRPKNAPTASAPGSRACECPPRLSRGAGEANAATTTSSIDAASRWPPNVRYSFEIPSRSMSRIRPQAKSSVLGIGGVRERPSLAPTAFRHPVVDGLRVEVLQRRNRPERDEQEGRARTVRQVGMGEEAPVSDARRDIGSMQARTWSGGPTAVSRAIRSPFLASRSSKGSRKVSSRSKSARRSASRANRSQRTSVIASPDGPCSRPGAMRPQPFRLLSDLPMVERTSLVAQRVWARWSMVGKSHLSSQAMCGCSVSSTQRRTRRCSVDICGADSSEVPGDLVQAIDARGELLVLVIHERPDHLPVPVASAVMPCLPRAVMPTIPPKTRAGQCRTASPWRASRTPWAVPRRQAPVSRAPGQFMSASRVPGDGAQRPGRARAG